MPAPDPRSAVIEQICAPRGVFETTGKSAGAWEGGFIRGGPTASARAETIDFVKERGISDDFMLLAVRFTDEDERQRFEFVGARRI